MHKRILSIKPCNLASLEKAAKDASPLIFVRKAKKQLGPPGVVEVAIEGPEVKAKAINGLVEQFDAGV